MEIVLSVHGFLNRKIKGKRSRKIMDKIKIFITYDITYWNNGCYNKGAYKSMTNKETTEELFEKLIKIYDNVLLEEVQERRTIQQYQLSE
jgi:hypothetical protein